MADTATLLPDAFCFLMKGAEKYIQQNHLKNGKQKLALQ
jgi:hypothetical protein